MDTRLFVIGLLFLSCNFAASADCSAGIAAFVKVLPDCTQMLKPFLPPMGSTMPDLPRDPNAFIPYCSNRTCSLDLFMQVQDIKATCNRNSTSDAVYLAGLDLQLKSANVSIQVFESIPKLCPMDHNTNKSCAELLIPAIMPSTPPPKEALDKLCSSSCFKQMANVSDPLIIAHIQAAMAMCVKVNDEYCIREVGGSNFRNIITQTKPEQLVPTLAQQCGSRCGKFMLVAGLNSQIAIADAQKNTTLSTGLQTQLAMLSDLFERGCATGPAGKRCAESFNFSNAEAEATKLFINLITDCGILLDSNKAPVAPATCSDTCKPIFKSKISPFGCCASYIFRTLLTYAPNAYEPFAQFAQKCGVPLIKSCSNSAVNKQVGGKLVLKNLKFLYATSDSTRTLVVMAIKRDIASNTGATDGAIFVSFTQIQGSSGTNVWFNITVSSNSDATSVQRSLSDSLKSGSFTMSATQNLDVSSREEPSAQVTPDTASSTAEVVDAPVVVEEQPSSTGSGPINSNDSSVVRPFFFFILAIIALLIN